MVTGTQPERATLSQRQWAILAGELSPKFLATLSTEGEPNVVPLLSLTPLEPELLGQPGLVGFAEFMMWKTKANLQSTGRAGILALDAKLNYFTASGTLRGFEVAGPLFDRLANVEMFRYNPYNGIRAAGSIALGAITGDGRIATAALLLAHLRGGRLARAAASLPSPSATSAPADPMPDRVAEKFGRLKALKAIAWPDGAGGVAVRPAIGVAPIGGRALVVADPAVAAAVPDGSRVALAVITLEPIAYQVKGIARRRPGSLLVEVTEAYTATPPVPGRLCRPAENGAVAPRDAATVGG